MILTTCRPVPEVRELPSLNIYLYILSFVFLQHGYMTNSIRIYIAEIIYPNGYFETEIFDRMLTGTTTSDQSRPGSNSYREVLHNTQSFRTGVSSLDAVCIFPRTPLFVGGWLGLHILSSDDKAKDFMTKRTKIF